jgi:hypothetical protein
MCNACMCLLYPLEELRPLSYLQLNLSDTVWTKRWTTQECMTHACMTACGLWSKYKMTSHHIKPRVLQRTQRAIAQRPASGSAWSSARAALAAWTQQIESPGYGSEPREHSAQQAAVLGAQPGQRSPLGPSKSNRSTCHIYIILFEDFG